MTQLNAYLHFNGNCREAMIFYANCLGGDLNMESVGESPMAAQMPGMEDGIMHSVLKSVLKNKDFSIMASDMMGPDGVRKGNTISLCITGESAKELSLLFSRLSEGGKVGNALKEEFFGMYGDLTDRFGVDWMFQANVKKVKRS